MGGIEFDQLQYIWVKMGIYGYFGVNLGIFGYMGKCGSPNRGLHVPHIYPHIPIYTPKIPIWDSDKKGGPLVQAGHSHTARERPPAPIPMRVGSVWV